MCFIPFAQFWTASFTLEWSWVSTTQVENSTRWESFLVHESTLVVLSVLFILYFVTSLRILYTQVDCSVWYNMNIWISWIFRCALTWNSASFSPHTGNRIAGRGILLWRSMSLNSPGWQKLTVCPKPRDGVDVGKLDDIMLYLDFSLKPVVKFALVIYIALCKHHYVKPLWELLLI